MQLDNGNNRLAAMARLAAEETDKRLAWESVTTAFMLTENVYREGKVHSEERAVTIAEARAHFDSLLYRAGVKPAAWKQAFWVDVPAVSVMLSIQAIMFFHGAYPHASAGRSGERVQLSSQGYAG